MRHTTTITRIPVLAETAPSTGLCTNIVDTTQARFCFVLAFLTDVFVPLIQPFVNLKAGSSTT